jgi:hypothetical protein
VFASKNDNDAFGSVANSGENSIENTGNSILVKIEEDEHTKKRSSQFIGVSFHDSKSKWTAKRWSKKEKRNVQNGAYRDEESAAHASDTLARKLIKNGEKGLKLNFPDDDTEVNPNPKEKTSIYVGVTSKKQNGRWRVYRKDKSKNNMTFYGTYKDEITAAHASDTLARKLMKNGERGLKLNFPDDNTEVYPEIQEQTSNYFGVTYNKQKESWAARRWSKIENKMVCNGSYKNEEKAAHASDTLAKNLIANGAKNHKLNFPNNDTKVHAETQNNKRKRPVNSNNSQKYGTSFDKFE